MVNRSSVLLPPEIILCHGNFDSLPSPRISEQFPSVIEGFIKEQFHVFCPTK
jgi:hypothetical protein